MSSQGDAVEQQARKNRQSAMRFLVIFLAIVAFVVYWRLGTEDNPGDVEVKKGNYRLEDSQFKLAIEEFESALRENPNHAFAHLGLALTYMQTERFDEAMIKFNDALAADPEMPAAYANRGILNDRLGKYELAIADYKKAMEIEPRMSEGPGWLWRFMRNVDKKPPSIQQRVDYLESELKKPVSERLLSVPEQDDKQRMYKVDG